MVSLQAATVGLFLPECPLGAARLQLNYHYSCMPHGCTLPLLQPLVRVPLDCNYTRTTLRMSTLGLCLARTHMHPGLLGEPSQGTLFVLRALPPHLTNEATVLPSSTCGHKVAVLWSRLAAVWVGAARISPPCSRQHCPVSAHPAAAAATTGFSSLLPALHLLCRVKLDDVKGGEQLVGKRAHLALQGSSRGCKLLWLALENGQGETSSGPAKAGLHTGLMLQEGR